MVELVGGSVFKRATFVKTFDSAVQRRLPCYWHYPLHRHSMVSQASVHCSVENGGNLVDVARKEGIPEERLRSSLLVCGGSPIACVLVECKAQHSGKLEQQQHRTSLDQLCVLHKCRGSVLENICRTSVVENTF